MSDYYINFLKAWGDGGSFFLQALKEAESKKVLEATIADLDVLAFKTNPDTTIKEIVEKLKFPEDIVKLIYENSKNENVNAHPYISRLRHFNELHKEKTGNTMTMEEVLTLDLRISNFEVQAAHDKDSFQCPYCQTKLPYKELTVIMLGKYCPLCEKEFDKK